MLGGRASFYQIDDRKTLEPGFRRGDDRIAILGAAESLSYRRKPVSTRPPEKPWTPGLRRVTTESPESVQHSCKNLGPGFRRVTCGSLRRGDD